VYEIPIGTNHTPWYPTEANPYTPELVDVLKETAALHYDLFPYIRSFTYQAHKTGLPVIRAAFLEFPNDEETYKIHGAYFFGSEIFVAPIASPDGQRSIYFPKGTKYLEYFNKTSIYAGGTTASVEMDVHYVPAYVRAGAIVPRGRIYQGNDKWTENWNPELAIELYPSPDVRETSFLYYSTDDKEVEIVMRMDPRTCEVVVEYDDLGCDGSFILYGKDGKATQSFDANAGSATFHNVQSLF
jgi:alpha-D-xyloside xylohydrolase